MSDYTDFSEKEEEVYRQLIKVHGKLQEQLSLQSELIIGFEEILKLELFDNYSMDGSERVDVWQTRYLINLIKTYQQKILQYREKYP